MDKELDELLDSALDDFDKKMELPKAAGEPSQVTIERTNLYVDDELDDEDRPPRTHAPKPASASAAAAAATSADPSSDEFKLFEEIFADEKNKDSMKKFKEMFEMLKTDDESKLMENFEKVMADLASDELNLGDDEEGDQDDEDEQGGNIDFFKNLAEKAFSSQPGAEATTSKPESATGDEKANPFHKVLNDLNKNSEKVLKDSADPFAAFGKEFLSSLENETNNLDPDSADSASSFMMQPILSMLFSKEILYPSLKMMSDNYDKYIEDKKATLSEQELDKCRAQKVCIQEMCSVYEQAKDSDSKEQKSDQLKKILDLLEKCGMPPSELVPEVNPFDGMKSQMAGATGCPIS